jgi:predicted nucleotidyltransferase
MIINILNNKSVWKLLALISYSPGSGYTRQEILRLLKWNNLSLDRTLKKLEFYKIIEKEKRIIKINFSNEESNSLLDIIEKDKKKLNYPSFELFLILNEFLRLIENKNIDFIYLFGSHAKKIASVKSDIDIAIFSDKKINLIEAKDKILQEFNKEIQLHLFKINEKGKLIDDILKNGVKIN